MTRRARRRAWLAALWTAAFGFGCSGGEPSEQVLTGRIESDARVVAIRAVAGMDVVTATQVTRDGTFRIALPAGARYRLELLTTTGVKPVLAHADGTWKALEFGVCVPSAPFDVGTISEPSHGGGMCDPMDPDCTEPCEEPPPPPPPCMDPMDPNCPPPPCMDPMDPNCPPPPPPPPPCMDPDDPWCQCQPDGSCPDPEPCTDPGDPNCMGGGEECVDPMDPTTCKDPCVIDPMQCGCPPGDPNCWPPPQPPDCMADGSCDPGSDPIAPANAPSDFGCTLVGIPGT